MPAARGEGVVGEEGAQHRGHEHQLRAFPHRLAATDLQMRVRLRQQLRYACSLRLRSHACSRETCRLPFDDFYRTLPERNEAGSGSVIADPHGRSAESADPQVGSATGPPRPVYLKSDECPGLTDNAGMGPPSNDLTRLARCLTGGEFPSPEPEAWFALVEAAGREGLAGLLLESAERRRVDLPLAAHLRLREQATHVASGTAHRLRSLAPIARAFADEGMPLLLLKGAALHLTLYSRPELRPMSDVDCMVPLDRAEDACALLDRLGCRRGPAPVRPGFFPTFHNELEYFTPQADHPVRLDVHARPFRPLRYAQSVPPHAFWEAATPMKLYGAAVVVPGAADMLIHLAVHAAIHGANRLLWLYDIYRFAAENSDQLDWPPLVARARTWGLLHPLRVGLCRTESVFGAFLPANARAALNHAHPSVLDRLVLWHAPRDEAHPLGHVAVNVLSIRGWRPRLRYLSAVLRPAREHLGGLYPWRHPGWTVCAHAWRVLRAVGRGVGMRRLTQA